MTPRPRPRRSSRASLVYIAATLAASLFVLLCAGPALLRALADLTVSRVWR